MKTKSLDQNARAGGRCRHPDTRKPGAEAPWIVGLPFAYGGSIAYTGRPCSCVHRHTTTDVEERTGANSDLAPLHRWAPLPATPGSPRHAAIPNSRHRRLVDGETFLPVAAAVAQLATNAAEEPGARPATSSLLPERCAGLNFISFGQRGSVCVLPRSGCGRRLSAAPTNGKRRRRASGGEKTGVTTTCLTRIRC